MNIKSKLTRVFGPLGGYMLGRFLTKNTPKIMMYHRFSDAPAKGFVNKEIFEQQVIYLKKNYHVLRLDEVLYALGGKGDLKFQNVAVITVDDGYEDFYEIAFPILKKYNLPATLFVTTRFVDGDFWLWPDKVKYILCKMEKLNPFDLPECQKFLIKF